jgi:hypothetical protein
MGPTGRNRAVAIPMTALPLSIRPPDLTFTRSFPLCYVVCKRRLVADSVLPRLPPIAHPNQSQDVPRRKRDAAAKSWGLGLGSANSAVKHTLRPSIPHCHSEHPAPQTSDLGLPPRAARPGTATPPGQRGQAHLGRPISNFHGGQSDLGRHSAATLPWAVPPGSTQRPFPGRAPSPGRSRERFPGISSASGPTYLVLPLPVGVGGSLFLTSRPPPAGAFQARHSPPAEQRRVVVVVIVPVAVAVAELDRPATVTATASRPTYLALPLPAGVGGSLSSDIAPSASGRFPGPTLAPSGATKGGRGRDRPRGRGRGRGRTRSPGHSHSHSHGLRTDLLGLAVASRRGRGRDLAA